MKKIVIGLSGGMDSTTLLGKYLFQGRKVHCCLFKYGSKHNRYENESALDVIEYYRKKSVKYDTLLNYSFFDLTNILGHLDSALLASKDEDIPEGHFEDESMKRTVVPGRNLLMASVMASVAESIGADFIGLGVHSGDHAIYPDCRAEFIKSLDTTIFLSTDKKVEVETPFQDMMKEHILRLGYTIAPQAPYHLTRTCYKDQELSCGKCGSCQERLEAFKLMGKEDPINYE